ncbi:MAG TPA: TonB-dependent receptor [Caulobacteraceae bacterium]|jgi:outer membrane receptor protein involved in Fe transport
MRRTYVFGLLASVSALALAAPAFAADAPPSKANTVQEVIVTAEKRPEAVKDVPLSITAVPQAQLEKLQAQDFADYVKLVPGLNIEGDSPGTIRLTLRGLNAGGVASTVAVYVDETPIGSSSGLVDGAVVAANYDPYDMNRIEVLRGPQGTLYGSNTEGGLLKFVTNAPVNHYEAAIEAGADTVSHGSTGWDVKGMVNIPIGDTLALRISGYDIQLPGWIDNPFLGLKDINKGFKDGGRAELEWKPTDKLSVRLTAFGQNMRVNGGSSEAIVQGGDTAHGNGVVTTIMPAFGDYTTFSRIPTPNSFHYRDYNGTIKYDMDFATLTSSTSYGTVNNLLVGDDTDAQAAPNTTVTFGDVVAGIVGAPVALPFRNQVDDSKFTQEFRLASPKVDNGLEWLAGAYYTTEKGSLNQHLQVSNPGSDKIISAVPDLEDPLLTSNYKEWAAFGDLTYHITPKWDISAGGRYSDQKQDAHETVSGLLVGNTSPPPFAVDISTASTSDVATWSLGTKYHLDADNMIYARYATGFRPGGPNVLPVGAPPGTPATYNADKNASYEAGWKASFDDGKVRLDAAVFYIDWRDIQVFEVVNGFGVNGNGGKAQSEGFEWAWTWVPIQGLTFSWTGADTNAALTTDAPGIFGKKGDSLPNVPKWASSLDGEYDWQAWEGGNAFVGATYSFQGGVSTDFDSSGLGRLRLPAYDTLDLRAGVQIHGTRFEVFGKNILNAKGFGSFGGNGGTLGLSGIGVLEPATWGVTIAKKF